MAKPNFNPDDFFDPEQKEPVPVPELPWYETLRIILEPYTPARDRTDSTEQLSSAEIISSIEQHHGVPQGPVMGEITKFVFEGDFVRAMRYLGYTAANIGGVQLVWLMKKKD